MSDEPEEPAVPEEAAAKASVPWVALIIILLVIPILTIAVMQFFVIPKLSASMAVAGPAAAGGAGAPAPDAHGGGHAPAPAPDAHGGGHGGGDTEGTDGIGNRMVFDELVTNVANTKGSRFLRTSFEIMSRDSNLRNSVKANKSQVHDAIITVLSNQTIADIEATGGRNKLRVALIDAINTALGHGIVEELYFLDLIFQ